MDNLIIIIAIVIIAIVIIGIWFNSILSILGFIFEVIIDIISDIFCD